ncbi:oligosaccharide flippase family protein, partial [Clostridium neonatale]|uniref:oligosaccharide flippase family protein n=1 Tax=Clostridium neonatale TaxID=137838 RepID=UPI003D33E61B
MKKERTLLKNTLIYAIGNFGSKMLTFLLLPLYTYYLTTSEYGYFDLVLSTITLCIPIITLQVNDGMYRDLLDCNKCDDISMIFSNTIIIIFINIIVLSLFYVILL